MNNTLLFIIANLRTGGSEIYLINLANWLSKNNFRVDILVLGKLDQKLLNTVNAEVNIYRIDYKQNRLFKIFYWFLNFISGPSYLFTLPFLNKTKNANYKYIHCFDTESVITASILFPKAKVSIGIYQKNEFFWESSLKYRKYRDQLLSRISISNVYTANPELLEKFKYYFKDQEISTTYNVFPFVVELPDLDFEEYQCDSKLIAIAARHSYTKGFIPFLISHYEDLLSSQGYILKIYGEGSETRKWMEEIPAGYADKISFEGNVDLKTLSDTINKAELFIGTGSTCILAAKTGTPTLVCSEGSHGDRAKGFFHELKFLHYYPRDDDTCTIKHIQTFITLPYSDKKNISSQTLMASKRYETIQHYKNMIKFFENLEIIEFDDRALKFKNILEIFIKNIFKIDQSYKYRINHENIF